MWFLIIWGTATVLTALLFIFLVADAYKRTLTYYNGLGIKCPSKKSSIGSKFAVLIRGVVVVICPILHLLFLIGFVLCYEEICQNTVKHYIEAYKQKELELLKEKENGC